MNGLRSMVETFFNVLNIEYTIGEYTFSLLDVFFAGCLLSLIGLFIGKVVLFFNNRR